MAERSRGRGVAAAVGFFLLFAGLVGGGVLYIVALRRPSQAVDGFARAPIGCTTTLEFTETGTFFVYQEAGAPVGITDSGCDPAADPATSFGVEFTGDLVPALNVEDDGVSYDVDGFDGRSVARIEIDEVGTYSIEVRGDDVTVLAAIGRDPDDGVDDLRRMAIIVAGIGVALGLVLLVIAGRRSKHAAGSFVPDGPGWGPKQQVDSTWPPAAPRVDQRPINPQQPPEPVEVEPPPPPLPARSPAEAVSWEPPSGDAEELPPPEKSPGDTPVVPGVKPVLPEAPGRPSGT